MHNLAGLHLKPSLELDLHSNSSHAIYFACPAFLPHVHVEGPYLDNVSDLLVLSLCSLTYLLGGSFRIVSLIDFTLLLTTWSGSRCGQNKPLMTVTQFSLSLLGTHLRIKPWKLKPFVACNKSVCVWCLQNRNSYVASLGELRIWSLKSFFVVLFLSQIPTEKAASIKRATPWSWNPFPFLCYIYFLSCPVIIPSPP